MGTAERFDFNGDDLITVVRLRQKRELDKPKKATPIPPKPQTAGIKV